MTSVKIIACSAVILLASAFTSIKLINWKVKPGYRVKVIEVGGEFKGLNAFISFDEDKPETSKISATIDAKSIDVGDATEKAKGVLETNKFPMIMFESTSITKTGPGKYSAQANLTIKGITKSVKFPFYFSTTEGSKTYPVVGKETFAGTFTIAPKEFNVVSDATKDKLTLELIIPVTK